MKKFKYKFPKYVHIAMIVAILLGITCLILQIIRLSSGDLSDTYDYVGSITVIAVSVLIIALVISILISSEYIVSEKAFILKWGFLKNEIPLDKITSTVYNSDTKKLAVFFNEDNYMLVSVYDVDLLDIVDALREKNKKITFESVSNVDGEDKDSLDNDKKA